MEGLSTHIVPQVLKRKAPGAKRQPVGYIAGAWISVPV